MKGTDRTRSPSLDYFVVKFDGQIKSEHHRFVDALTAGLLLRDQFPQHEVKVHSIAVRDAAEDRVLH